ncbi:MAG TPA: DNA gyrase inhibitor YacG [Hyphomicrobiaceae bacterium]|nr:DNA gyrase inhibitor YacG [Hyphomicrobiaceae bacterium]
MAASDLENKPCPVCGAPGTIAHRPFCSRRCADIDLSRWFRGRYVIAGQSENQNDPERQGASHEPDAGHRGRGDDG